MSVHETRHSLVRPSVVLASALSCGVVCAAAVGALTAPVVAAALVLAMFAAALSLHEHDDHVARHGEPFSVSSRVQLSVVKIEAPHASQATRRADVA